MFMAHLKEDFKCPNCKKKNRLKIRSEVSSADIDKLIDKSYFKMECSSCHETIIVEYPIKVIDERYIIHYTPASDKPIDDEKREYMRVCDTYDDFKEKLLIFNDFLNDIIIEFLKDYLYNQLDDKLKKDTTYIRYDGSDEENLLFYLIGANQTIGCSREFYKRILDNSKIKKIDKCLNIDHYTYKKYFKMR